MSALKFRHRIRFEAIAAVVDPLYGPQPGAWAPIPNAEAWAEVQDALPSKTNESTSEGVRLGRDAARVRLRYRADLDATMRIVELGGLQRTMQIIAGPAPIHGGREIELMVERFSS